MAQTIAPHFENILQSLVYLLKNEPFLKETGEAKTLRDWLVQDGAIADLTITIGFPASLDQIDLPALALVPGVLRPTVDLAYNEVVKDYSLTLTIFGFAGGYAEDHQNTRQQHRLMNEVKLLLEQAEFFPIYGLAPSGALDTAVTLNQGEIRQVTARTIPVTGLGVSQRFRFALDVEVTMLRALHT